MAIYVKGVVDMDCLLLDISKSNKDLFSEAAGGFISSLNNGRVEFIVEVECMKLRPCSYGQYHLMAAYQLTKAPEAILIWSDITSEELTLFYVFTLFDHMVPHVVNFRKCP